jgi:hypothetical protein
MNFRFTRLALPFAALVAITGVAAAVWASAPAQPVAIDWRRIEKICIANGGHYQRTDGGGACIEALEPLD